MYKKLNFNDMVNALVRDSIESVIQLGQNGDYLELEAWLGPIFKEDFESCSEDEIRSRYVSQGLEEANSEEEE